MDRRGKRKIKTAAQRNQQEEEKAHPSLTGDRQRDRILKRPEGKGKEERPDNTAPPPPVIDYSLPAAQRRLPHARRRSGSSSHVRLHQP